MMKWFIAGVAAGVALIMAWIFWSWAPIGKEMM
jgi:hypothetical protein